MKEVMPGRERPLRILRIIARMNVGGPAWQVSVLTRGIDTAWSECRLLTGEVDEGEADFLDLRDPGLIVEKVPFLGRSVRFGDDLRAFLAIRRAILDFKPDLVHTHTAKAGLLGRLAAISCRVPLRVHTFHGHLLSGYFGRLASWTLILIERVLARGTTALVAVGAQVRDDLIKVGIGKADQYTVIPPGVELVEIRDRGTARAQLDLPAESPVVLFVGRITAIKRLDRLVDAMAAVLDRHSDAVLVVAGEGECLKEIERQARPLGDSVRFLGWQEDVGRLYAAADCVVITSHNEGMPVSLIEAAMAGVPGVTTDVGSAGEVILDGVTGLVVGTDPAEVAEGLLRVLQADVRDQMGSAARRRAEIKFSSQRLIQDHQNLYRMLVAQGW